MKPLLASLSLLLAAAAGPSVAYTRIDNPGDYLQPLFLTAPSGDSRLFVVEKGGAIKMRDSLGAVSTVLNLSAQIDTAGERGLLGMAFDPGFATNNRFYVNYIDKTTLSTVVASYTLDSSGVADPASARTIITVAQPAGRSNHKGGWIGFSAADPGQLYIATGDGGSGNDPDNLAQNLNSNLGKLLRITPDAVNGGYAVPTTNPFVGAAGNDEIWAYGLRNPFRNSFDRLTGDLWIGDVGQGAREEVNFASAASGLGRGANYGWRVMEGSIPTPGIGDPNPGGLTGPLFDYDRSVGGTVIGGYVYHGVDASLDGKYVFGDFVSGKIWSYSNGTRTELGDPFDGFELTSFGEGGDGSLYAVGINGDIYLLAAAVPEPGPALLLAVGLAAGGLLTRRRRS
jgi:glucose/arabinose dehydrogenase